MDIMDLGNVSTTPSWANSFSDITPIGLPQDSQDWIPPGLEQTSVSVSPAPQISTLDSIWNTIKADSESAIDYVEQAPGRIWQAAKDDASGAISSVSNAVGGTLTSVYWYGILAVAVLVVGVYFIGKSGAIGQAASFGK